MSVGTHEHALCDFSANCSERSRQTTVSNPKVLSRRISVMELKSTDVPVVAANAAAAAGLSHNDLLQPSPAARDGLGAAAQASVDAASLEPEDSLAMPWAGHDLPVWISPADACGVSAPSAMGSQSVAPEPMPNRGLTQAQALRDLSSREAGIDEAGKCLLIDAALRSVTVAMNRRESVPLHPVSDGRCVSPRELANLL